MSPMAGTSPVSRMGTWIDQAVGNLVWGRAGGVQISLFSNRALYRICCVTRILPPACLCPQILFTRELRRRLAASPLPEDHEALAPGVLAVHPGLVCTGVARGLPAWMQVGVG